VALVFILLVPLAVLVLLALGSLIGGPAVPLVAARGSVD
jgi:hypothetical protein